MKRANTEKRPSEAQPGANDAGTGVYGPNRQGAGACLRANGEAGEALNEAPYYNIAITRKAAARGEGLEPRLLNIRQLSDYLAMPVATLYTMRCLGRIPSDCIVRFGRSLRFDRQAVDRWIGEQRARP